MFLVFHYSLQMESIIPSSPSSSPSIEESYFERLIRFDFFKQELFKFLSFQDFAKLSFVSKQLNDFFGKNNLFYRHSFSAKFYLSNKNILNNYFHYFSTNKQTLDNPQEIRKIVNIEQFLRFKIENHGWSFVKRYIDSLKPNFSIDIDPLPMLSQFDFELIARYACRSGNSKGLLEISIRQIRKLFSNSFIRNELSINPTQENVETLFALKDSKIEETQLTDLLNLISIAPNDQTWIDWIFELFIQSEKPWTYSELNKLLLNFNVGQNKQKLHDFYIKYLLPKVSSPNHLNWILIHPIVLKSLDFRLISDERKRSIELSWAVFVGDFETFQKLVPNVSPLLVLENGVMCQGLLGQVLRSMVRRKSNNFEILKYCISLLSNSNISKSFKVKMFSSLPSSYWHLQRNINTLLPILLEFDRGNDIYPVLTSLVEKNSNYFQSKRYDVEYFKYVCQNSSIKGAKLLHKISYERFDFRENLLNSATKLNSMKLIQFCTRKSFNIWNLTIDFRSGELSKMILKASATGDLTLLKFAMNHPNLEIQKLDKNFFQKSAFARAIDHNHVQILKYLHEKKEITGISNENISKIMNTITNRIRTLNYKSDALLFVKFNLGWVFPDYVK